jgi:hypothetical protein
MTFDLKASTVVGYRYDWQQLHEAFCVCRHCGKTTIYVLSDRGIHERDAANKQGLPNVKGAVNDYVKVERYITARDRQMTPPPDHLPDTILAAFQEGATCLSADCFNAAGTMFRLCVDLATRSLLPDGEHAGLNTKVRRDLGLRLPWLFDKGLLPASLRDLSHCIKEDGNDGAHAGTLGRADAEDLLDFTTALLERLYAEPKKIELAQQRRAARRATAA